MFAVLSISALGQEDSTSNWFKKGVEFYNNGSYDLAEKCFDKAIEQNPKSLESWIYKGEILGLMGKYNETINASEKAIEIDPLNASGWRMKGIALAWQDKRGEAIHAIDNAIEIDPQSALLRDSRIIVILLGLDDRGALSANDAIQELDNTIELNPQDAFAWLIKGGVAYYVSNQADESMQEVFDKAIDLDPNSSLAWYAKGYFYARLGKYNESIQAYDKALKSHETVKQDWCEFFLVDSRIPYVLYLVKEGEVLEDLEKYDEAIKAYDEAIKAYEKLSFKKGLYIYDPYIRKGQILYKLGRYNESIKAYDKAIVLDPRNVDAWAGKDLALKGIMQVVNSADRLSTYRIKSSVTQTLKLNSGANATSEKLTTVTESAETVAVVNLSNLEAHASGSTKNQMEMPGQPANTSTSIADVYQIGNSTYVNESGNWTHLADPRSKQEVWGPDKNNQVKAIAETFNLSTTENLGSEAINGEDAYKLKIVTGSGDNISLYNAAFAIAAKVTQYPMYLPSVNRTELNDTGKIEKIVWISKKSYLPVKYQSLMSFSMTPEIIGALDPNTSQMKMLNQSIRLGEISVRIETADLYYDFDTPVKITLPQEAATAWTNNGLALSAQGKYEEAVQAFDTTVEINPQDALAWNGKGYALSAQGKYDEALVAFDKAIEIDPRFAVAWQNKGEALMRLNRGNEANDTFTKAKDLRHTG